MQGPPPQSGYDYPGQQPPYMQEQYGPPIVSQSMPQPHQQYGLDPMPSNQLQAFLQNNPPGSNVYNMPGETLDRHRYLAKIQQASNKQLQLFQKAQQFKASEGSDPKEKLFQKYMNGAPQSGSLFDPNLYGNSGQGGNNNMGKQPMWKNVSQLELQDPEARAGLTKILDVQMKEKADKKLREQEIHRQYQDRMRMQIDAQTKEQKMHEQARKDLQQDYRYFLDQQKLGNAQLREQQMIEHTGNPNPRRNGAHAMLPPRPQQQPPPPGFYPGTSLLPQGQQPFFNNTVSGVPPYGVDGGFNNSLGQVPPSRNGPPPPLRGSFNQSLNNYQGQPPPMYNTMQQPQGPPGGMAHQGSQAQLYLSSVAARNMMNNNNISSNNNNSKEQYYT